MRFQSCPKSLRVNTSSNLKMRKDELWEGLPFQAAAPGSPQSKMSGSASMHVSQGLRGMWGMEMRSRATPLRMSRVKAAQAHVKDQE